jgi:hypothetical protein
MKDINMKSFYRHEVPVNRYKTDITINKKTKKGTKKLSLKWSDSKHKRSAWICIF